jgi:hypothetical protein
MALGHPVILTGVAVAVAWLWAGGIGLADEAQPEAAAGERPAEEAEIVRGPTEADPDQARQLRQRAVNIQGLGY